MIQATAISLSLFVNKLQRIFTVFQFGNLSFSNSDIGNDLASENYLNQHRRTRDAWLGMYTYNPVEGAYFDDKPGGYLGVF